MLILYYVFVSFPMSQPCCVNSVDAYNSVWRRALKSPTLVASSARRAGGGARTAEGWGSSRGQVAASAAC